MNIKYNIRVCFQALTVHLLGNTEDDHGSIKST
jgi:hypothetical protein